MQSAKGRMTWKVRIYNPVCRAGFIGAVLLIFTGYPSLCCPADFGSKFSLHPYQLIETSSNFADTSGTTYSSSWEMTGEEIMRFRYKGSINYALGVAERVGISALFGYVGYRIALNNMDRGEGRFFINILTGSFALSAGWLVGVIVSELILPPNPELWKVPDLRLENGDGYGINMPKEEFIKYGGELARKYRLDPQITQRITPNSTRTRFVDIELAQQAVGGPGYLAKYYSVSGKELWRGTLCCLLGVEDSPQIVFSKDGNTLAILDSSDTWDNCLEEKEGKPSPKGCIGLRIIDMDGRERFRSAHARNVLLSPSGSFALVQIGGIPIMHVDLSSGLAEFLPVAFVDRYMPTTIYDSGAVRFSEIPRWYKKETKDYLYVPGKGLEKVEAK